MAELCSLYNDLEMNPGAVLGIILGLAAVSGRDKLTLVADKHLSPLGAWLEQLVAESSGKDGKGIVPIANEPTLEVDLYGSDRIFVYLRHDGGRDEFIEDLLEVGQPVLTLDIPDLYSLGAEFYRWEYAAAVACSILDVNAFDQPDVQDSKNRTKKKLQVYLETGELKERDVIWEKEGNCIYGVEFDGLADCISLSEVIEGFTSQAKQEDYIAINAYIPRNEQNLAQLTSLRASILENTGCATTLGFGPRFLHSTGQLHKGGAENGLFIQITQEDGMDIEIPGKDYSFGILARAQAQGDLEALLARNKRTIRLHLKADQALDLQSAS
jgi:transaldolase/glucose-6-phosphate isomerase